MENPQEDIMSNHKDNNNNNNNNGGGEFYMPGFRFYTTEEELVGFYLKKMVEGKRFSINIIETLDLYQYDPWQLPGLARGGEREWYFFVPRDKKYPNGGRPNRIAASGYWKATGSDKQVRNEALRCIGLKKTLVFYTGRAPRGQKTDWVMNEYRLPDFNIHKSKKQMVLCRIHRKATPLKWLEQQAMGEDSERGPAERSSWDSMAVHDAPDLHMTEIDGFSLTKCNVNYQAAFEDSEASDPVDFLTATDDGPSCRLPPAGAATDSDATYNGCGHVATDVKPAKGKPPRLEVPKLRGDIISELSANQLHSVQRSPLADIWTPSALLCTPQGFDLWPHTSAIGCDVFDQPFWAALQETYTPS